MYVIINKNILMALVIISSSILTSPSPINRLSLFVADNATPYPIAESIFFEVLGPMARRLLATLLCSCLSS